MDNKKLKLDEWDLAIIVVALAAHSNQYLKKYRKTAKGKGFVLPATKKHCKEMALDLFQGMHCNVLVKYIIESLDDENLREEFYKGAIKNIEILSPVLPWAKQFLSDVSEEE